MECKSMGVGHRVSCLYKQRSSVRSIMRQGWFVALLFIIAMGLTGCGTGQSINILKTGAIGDGKAMCTSAFQNALDKVAKTGGEVVVPAGNFKIGSVVMASNTTIKLEKGAVLTG